MSKKQKIYFANLCRANTQQGEKIITQAREYVPYQEIIKQLTRKAQNEIEKCKKLLTSDIKKCFKQVYKMMFEYVVVLKTMFDNNNYFSSLDTGAYYTAYGLLDPHYKIKKAKDSFIYDKELLSSRIENIQNLLNEITAR